METAHRVNNELNTLEAEKQTIKYFGKQICTTSLYCFESFK